MLTPRRSTAASSSEPLAAFATAKIVFQIAFPLVVVFAGVSIAAALFRAELQAIGIAFVARFGYAGMALGSFLSDAFMCPIPPQFYMLTAVAAGAPQVTSITVVCVASVLAANVAYHVASRLSHIPFFRTRIERSRGKIDPLFVRYGPYAVALGAVLPIPFSLLCYLAGLYRIPYRLYAILVLLRVPRLLAFYFLIRAGWGKG